MSRSHTDTRTHPQDQQQPARRGLRRQRTLRLEKPPTVKKQVLAFIKLLVVDIILPVGIYFGFKSFLPPVWALLIACTPPLFSVVIKGIIYRKADIIGLLVFIAFGISALVAATTNNARILMLEKSLVTVVLGLAFLVTLIPLRIRWKGRVLRVRPIVFMIMKELVPLGKVEVLDDGKGSIEGEKSNTGSVSTAATVPESEEPEAGRVAPEPRPELAQTETLPTSHQIIDLPSTESLQTETPRTSHHIIDIPSTESAPAQSPPTTPKWDLLYTTSARLRRDSRILTIFWGVILILEFVGRLIMVISPLDIDLVVLYANIYFAVVIIIAVLVTVAYAIPMKRRIKAELDRWEAVGIVKGVVESDAKEGVAVGDEVGELDVGGEEIRVGEDMVHVNGSADGRV